MTVQADLVPAAARTLDVLEAFRAARGPLSLSEIARRARIPVSTCHGLLRTLERRGFLYFPSQREAYPTRRLLDIAREIAAHDPIAQRLAPTLERLRDKTQETVILGARQADAVLYLLVLESPQIVRYTARAGEFKPLHASAIGKALLGTLDDAALSAWLDEHSLARVTERTLTSARALRRDVATSRAKGHFVTRGENVPDVMAIAAPVRSAFATLGVGIAGPLTRMDPLERRHAAELAKCVADIEEQLRGD